MTNDELREILANHKHWIDEDCEGWQNMRADLRRADLQGADLREADLRGADLRRADLRGADLQEADLQEADLWGANLRGADLREADLRGADLREADLRGANLRRADLRRADLQETDLWGADLQEADLRGADLRRADLRGADLREADLREADLRGARGCYTSCPCDGEFTAWKKCRINGNDGECIVKLLIPADAKRSSATTEKCRADKAIVVDIQTLDGETLGTDATAYSQYDSNFVYKVGETVVSREPFCEDRWVECASGIHFFIDRRAAAEY